MREHLCSFILNWLFIVLTNYKMTPCVGVIVKNPSIDIKRILRCADFAAIKHSNQRRINKAQTPYINHPIGVANIIAQEANITDPYILCAALLHDTVSDTNTTVKELKQRFGTKISSIVSECTGDLKCTKEERQHMQDCPGGKTCLFNPLMDGVAQKQH